MSTGVLILAGLTIFTVVDKLFSVIKDFNVQAELDTDKHLQGEVNESKENASQNELYRTKKKHVS